VISTQLTGIMKGFRSASSWVARLAPESVLGAGDSLTSVSFAVSVSSFPSLASVSSFAYDDPIGAVGSSV